MPITGSKVAKGQRGSISVEIAQTMSCNVLIYSRQMVASCDDGWLAGPVFIASCGI